MKLFLIGLLIIFIVFAIILIILKNTPICEGGELFTGCGKALFPWRKKFKLPSGKFCCMNCYANDLKMFAKMKIESDNKMRFTVEEEEFLDGDSDDSDNKVE